jgi:hypothetical protein
LLAKFLKTTPGFHQFCCSTEEVRAALAAAKVFSFVSGQREREREREREGSSERLQFLLHLFSHFGRLGEGGRRGTKKRKKKSRDHPGREWRMQQPRLQVVEEEEKLLGVSYSSLRVQATPLHFSVSTLFFFSFLSLPSFLH